MCSAKNLLVLNVLCTLIAFAATLKWPSISRNNLSPSPFYDNRGGGNEDYDGYPGAGAQAPIMPPAPPPAFEPARPFADLRDPQSLYYDDEPTNNAENPMLITGPGPSPSWTSAEDYSLGKSELGSAGSLGLGGSESIREKRRSAYGGGRGRGGGGYMTKYSAGTGRSNFLSMRGKGYGRKPGSYGRSRGYKRRPYPYGPTSRSNQQHKPMGLGRSSPSFNHGSSSDIVTALNRIADKL